MNEENNHLLKVHSKKFSYIDFPSASILYKPVGYLPLSEYNKGILNMDEKVQEKLGAKEFDKENGEIYKGVEKEVIGETFLKVNNNNKKS